MRTKETSMKKGPENRMKVSPKAAALRTTETMSSAARCGDDGTGCNQGQFTSVTRISLAARLFLRIV
jgi:hypothetical protein